MDEKDEKSSTDVGGAPVPYPKHPSWYKRPSHVEDIDDALSDVQVHGPGSWENDLSKTALGDWYAVSTGDDAIIAYFFSETDALSFRLKIIDRWFNG